MSTLQGHMVEIDWYGKHPFYTPQTLSEYQEGHYHYICRCDTKTIKPYILQIMGDFSGYKHLWGLQVLLGGNTVITLNNHCSDIYMGKEKLEKEAYNVSICHLEQAPKTTASS